MPQESNSTFEGTFEDEETSSGEEESSGDEESSEEDESSTEEPDDEVPMSKSGLPFDQKVEMFEQGGFDDEDGESESGSEYSSEEDESSESESESEGSSDEEDGPDSFVNEQERLRGMGGIPPDSAFRRWYVIGLAIFCVVLLGLAVGLGVGLSRKKKNINDEEKPAVSGTAPANPPVRMPIKLPNPPKISEPPVEAVNIEVVANGGSTFYRSGEPEEDIVDTVLVQGGDPGNDELGNAFAVMSLPIDIDEIQYLLDNEKRNATFCFEHVPNEEDPDRVVTYSACLLAEGNATASNLENALIPDDCVDGSYFMQFDVSPGDTTVCMDVTDMLYLVYLGNSNGGSDGGRRALKEQTLLMMIDNLDASDEPGDRFATDKTTLTITGEKIPDCKTIADLVCSRQEFNLFCENMKNAGMDLMLGDNRVPFTVFVPSNGAFLSMASKFNATLDLDLLGYVLMTHTVVQAKIQSSFIDCSLDEIPPVRMANGEVAAIKCDSDSIFVIGDGNSDDALPKIVSPDIETCNGIVHTIDSVILPAQVLPNTDSKDEDTTDGDAACPSFAEAICSHEALGSICTMYNLFQNDPIMADLFELVDTIPTTLFLPSNEPAMALSSLYVSDTQPIKDLILNHAVQGVVEAKDLKCGGELEMEGGGTTKTVCDGEKKFQVGEFNADPFPEIIVADILYCTGVIHVVDQVILINEVLLV